MAGKTIGLTTGQAARYCLVSPDTIVKWIKEKDLPAQRTVGGQFRIFVDSLRRFMLQNQMSTTLLDAEVESRPYCWECHLFGHKRKAFEEEFCRTCPAYRTKALNCYELRAIHADRWWADRECEACDYFQRWGDSSSSETPV